MSAAQVGSWQNTFGNGAPFVQSFTLTQAAASGRALVVFASGVAGADTMSVPTFNGVAPTFSSKRSNAEEASGTGSFIAVCVWMNSDLPATAGAYNVSFPGANYGKALSICEFSGVDPTAVIKTAEIANARNTALTVTLAGVAADSLNFALHSNNPGYSADWVNVNSDTVVYAGSGNVYCKPYLLSRHGATGTLNFAPTTTGTGESDSWTNWRHGAAISLASLAVSEVNGGDPIYPGQTGVPATAAGFTGAATVSLVSDGLTQAQAFTYDAGVFSITITQGELPFGAAVMRFVEGLESLDVPVTLTAAPGNAVVDVVGVDTTEDSIFYEYAEYATIEQIEYTNAAVVTVSAAGLVTALSPTTFRVRMRDGSTWSAFSPLITIALGGSMATVPLVWPATDQQMVLDGVTYGVHDGNIYTYPEDVLVVAYYDPDYISENYTTDGVNIYVLDGETEYLAYRSRTEPFSPATHVRDLIGPGKTFTGMTLQSPAAPTVDQYNALSAAIIAGTADFIDNRIDVVTGRGGAVVGGVSPGLYRATARQVSRVLTPRVIGPTPDTALRFTAVAHVAPSTLTKCSIDSTLFFFSKGDAVVLSGWFKIVSGNPTTLMDFESSYLTEGPGVRVIMQDLVPRVQFKFGSDPKFSWTQSGTPVALEVGEWTKIELYVKLDDTSAGAVQLKIDDVLKISGTGRTMPLADTVYNRVQVGLSANSSGAVAVLEVDDLNVDRVLTRVIT